MCYKNQCTNKRLSDQVGKRLSAKAMVGAGLLSWVCYSTFLGLKFKSRIWSADADSGGGSTSVLAQTGKDWPRLANTSCVFAHWACVNSSSRGRRKKRNLRWHRHGKIKYNLGKWKYHERTRVNRVSYALFAIISSWVDKQLTNQFFFKAYSQEKLQKTHAQIFRVAVVITKTGKKKTPLKYWKESKEQSQRNGQINSGICTQ